MHLKKIGENYLSVFFKGLNQLLEMMMTNTDNLRKPLTSHCERLRDIKHHTYFPKHFLRPQLRKKLSAATFELFIRRISSHIYPN